MSGIRVRGRLRPARTAPEHQEAPPVAPREAPRQAVSRAARQLALAHYIERLIEAGDLAGYAEAARTLGVTRARITQLANLLLLPPETQECIVAGSPAASERVFRAVINEPAWPLPPFPRRHRSS